MKMTMAEFVGLEPCPFCGGEASVKVLEYGEDCKVWGVFCESDLQSEYSHGHFVDNYATEAEAIEAWNTRAEQTCKQERIFNLIERECDGKYYSWRGDEMPTYCPNCGCKVVGK